MRRSCDDPVEVDKSRKAIAVDAWRDDAFCWNLRDKAGGHGPRSASRRRTPYGGQ